MIGAARQHAPDDGTIALAEATSHQVDQDAGCTGWRPEDFRRVVEGIADRVGLPTERLVLGGDHRGPDVWRASPAEDAPARAEHLVAGCAAAGSSTIHLDRSTPRADDSARRRRGR